jgi:CubicO group peptidase (beta-lactamase class C family)
MIFVSNSLCAPKAGRVFPSKDWAKASPESQGVDSVKLEEAMTYLAGICGPAKTNHTLVVRHGYMIWQGKDIDSVFDAWSVTKSFTGTCLGLLIDDRKCSLQTLVKKYFPAAEAKYPKLTLRHLATLTDGYMSVEGEKPYIPADPLFEPGTRFHYSEGPHVLSYCLCKIAGEPISQLFKRRIADPIGLNPSKWWWGDWGEIDGIKVNGGSGTYGKGIHISARELAKVGYLFLNKGSWNGTQLISKQWVEEATKPQNAGVAPFDTNGWYNCCIVNSYGYNFWVNGVKLNGERNWPAAPPNTAALQGNYNAYCFFIPEWDMVIARMGHDSVIDNALYNGLFIKVKAALKDPGK